MYTHAYIYISEINEMGWQKKANFAGSFRKIFSFKYLMLEQSHW